MNIFSKLFGRRKSPVSKDTPIADTQTTANLVTDEVIPTKELFVATEEPVRKSDQPDHIGRISKFLGLNYHGIGFRDGYEYHSSESMIIGKRKIGSEFRLIIDQEIQEKEEKRLQLENIIIDVSTISPLTLQKLKNTLEKIEKSIEKLEKQKELSIEDEGWVMNAIYNYQSGFEQGLSDYIESETMLNSTKFI